MSATATAQTIAARVTWLLIEALHIDPVEAFGCAELRRDFGVSPSEIEMVRERLQVAFAIVIQPHRAEKWVTILDVIRYIEQRMEGRAA